MPLHLRWKADTRIPVEAECIRPDSLRGLALDDVRRLTVQFGNQKQSLGEFFDVSSTTGGDEVVVEGDCPTLRRVGEGMTGGRITIEGNVGMHVGAEMTGGEIVVRGNVTDWLGAEMHGGRIHVRGGEAGPDLSTIARTLDHKKLTEAILEPAGQISPQYVTWTIATRDGQVLSGIILREGTREITLEQFTFIRS